MSKLQWDRSGERFFETGVDQGVLYVMKDVHTEGETTAYEPGVEWNGLTGVTNSPDGAEPNDLYADNIKYATLRSAETFGATIEAYTYPVEFGQCDGSASPTAGVYVGQQSRKTFGFCYRTKVGDDTDTEASKYKIHVIYGCSASPSERAYETVNDSPDAITFSWEITTTPTNVGTFNGVDYKPTSEIVIDVWRLTTDQKNTLEDALYGTANSDPTLPTPERLLGMIVSPTTTE